MLGILKVLGFYFFLILVWQLPAWANTAPRALGFSALKVNEDSSDRTVDLSLAFADSEQASSALTYTLVSNSNVGIFSQALISGSSLNLSFKPDASGIADLRIKATDAGALSVEASLRVFLVPVNDLPTCKGIANINITGANRSASLDLKQYFLDKEDASSKLKYSLSSVTPPNVLSSAQIDANGILTLSASNTAAGQVAITIRATDSNGGFVERELNGTNFKVYHNFGAEEDAGKTYPDPRPLGIKHAFLATNWCFFKSLGGSLYDQSKVEQSVWSEILLAKHPAAHPLAGQYVVPSDGRPIVLDIENETYFGNTDLGRNNLASALYPAQQAHLTGLRPEITTLGYYMLLPERTWWEAVNYHHVQQSVRNKWVDGYSTPLRVNEYTEAYNKWLERNAWYRSLPVSSTWGGKPLNDLVDVIYPSLYTFYRNIDWMVGDYAAVYFESSTNTVYSPNLPYTDGAQISFVKVSDGTLPVSVRNGVYYIVEGAQFVGNGSRFKLRPLDSSATLTFAAGFTSPAYAQSKGPWDNLWEDSAVVDWQYYASYNIAEARKYLNPDNTSKPIITYLAPSYIGDDRVYLEREFFKFQLQTVYNLKVNGVVVYAPLATGGPAYLETTEWWKALKEFMLELNSPLTKFTVNVTPSSGNSPPAAPSNLKNL